MKMQQAAGWGAAVTLVAGLVTACGGAGARTVVGSRELSGASSAPHVTRVTDLGQIGLIPAEGVALPAADSDGVFVVGELVLIEGDDFGKLPTVNIGGRPAEPLARTGNGGIVARIPAGVPTGAVEVEVSHTRGRGARGIQVVRYGLVVQPNVGVVHVIRFRAGAESGKAAVVDVVGALEIPGARFVGISHDGVAGYVAADAEGSAHSATVHVVALSASGKPSVKRVLRLPGKRMSAFVSAAAAPVSVLIVDSRRIYALDTGNAMSPALSQGKRITGIKGVTAAAVNAKGTLLAVLEADGNNVLPVTLARGEIDSILAPVNAMPGQQWPLVTALGFAPKGETLWVMVGDTDVSLLAGNHPAGLVQITVAGSSLSVAKAGTIADVDAPLAMAVARREAIGSAAAIRTTAHPTAIVCASVERAVVRAASGNEDAANPPEKSRPFGRLRRVSVDGTSAAVWDGEAAITAVALSFDARTVVAATTAFITKKNASGLAFGIAVSALEGGKVRVLELGTGSGQLLDRASVALAP